MDLFVNFMKVLKPEQVKGLLKEYLLRVFLPLLLNGQTTALNVPARHSIRGKRRSKTRREQRVPSAGPYVVSDSTPDTRMPIHERHAPRWVSRSEAYFFERTVL